MTQHDLDQTWRNPTYDPKPAEPTTWEIAVAVGCAVFTILFLEMLREVFL